MPHALSSSPPALAKRGSPGIGLLNLHLRRDRRRMFPTYLRRHFYAPTMPRGLGLGHIQSHLLSNFIIARFFLPLLLFLAYFFFAMLSETREVSHWNHVKTYRTSYSYLTTIQTV
jgi:hypothetical protein